MSKHQKSCFFSGAVTGKDGVDGRVKLYVRFIEKCTFYFYLNEENKLSA